MKMFERMKCWPLLLVLALVVLLGAPAMSLAAQPTVNLGTAASYAVLAGSTVTNTGPTTVTGDIGLYPGTAFTGEASVTIDGAVNINNAAAEQAQTDLVTAYNDAAGRTPVTSVPTELGETTLKPGVYASSNGTLMITGTLTLDAEGDPNAVFIFQASSTLTTMTDSRIRLINGARFCRVFWQVGSSATLGVNSQFVGHIFAMTSITAQTGATVQGQLLARNGAVTLDSNTITNAICTTVRVTPRLTLKLSGLTKGVVKVGREVTAKGKLTPIVLAGSRVKITVQKLVNGKWVTVKTAMRRTTSTGTYSWRYLPPKSGTYRTRTTIAGTPTSTSATTTWRRFTVVSAPIPPFTG